MIEAGYPTEEVITGHSNTIFHYYNIQVEFMRSMLEHERWQFHPLLPEGWMVKDSSASGAAKISKEYLSWDATLLRSYKVALEFLRASSATSEDIASFEEFAADDLRMKAGSGASTCPPAGSTR